MDLEYLLNTKSWTSSEFEDYVKSCGGIYKLKKKNLDKLMEAQTWLIREDSFMDIYRMVSDNESSKVIRVWTWIAGFASITSLIISIIRTA